MFGFIHHEFSQTTHNIRLRFKRICGAGQKLIYRIFMPKQSWYLPISFMPEKQQQQLYMKTLLFYLMFSMCTFFLRTVFTEIWMWWNNNKILKLYGFSPVYIVFLAWWAPCFNLKIPEYRLFDTVRKLIRFLWFHEKN